MGTSLPEKTSTTGNHSKEKTNTVPSLFNGISLLAPLKAPKSYGTYSKQQQEEVIAFIKDGNSLRTAEKFFGIPKSTMHCWLKKIHNANSENSSNKGNNTKDSLDCYSMVNGSHDRDTFIRKSPVLQSPPSNLSTPSVSPLGDSRSQNSMTAISSDASLSNTSENGKKPQSQPQIIIEEAELIRFLQTGEGAELIGKAYNVPVTGFLDFVKNSQLTKKDTNQKFSGNLKNVDIASLLKQGATIKEEIKSKTCSHGNNMYHNGGFSSHVVRKRNHPSSGCNCQSNGTLRTTRCLTELKKPKLECVEEGDCNIAGRTGGSTTLEALLTKPRGNLLDASKNKIVATSEKNGLFLTHEQLRTSSKLISQAQPGVVSTYLVTVPLSNISTNLNTTVRQGKLNDDLEECELSPTYPKLMNPVSIKAEPGESDEMMQPPSECLSYTLKEQTVPTLNITMVGSKMEKLLSQATKPVVSTNATASLNLNEINRTQSERELMALVDGDVVTADELCTDFKETLELNKWENWYSDQYLQHFQPSPGGVLSNSSQHSGDMLSPSSVRTASDIVTSPSATSLEDNLHLKSDDEEDDGLGITFASNTDKDKILVYLSEGNSVADAERKFDISQSTINMWLNSVNREKPETPDGLIQNFKQEPYDEINNLNVSAFSHQTQSINRTKPHYTKSAFARQAK